VKLESILTGAFVNTQRSEDVLNIRVRYVLVLLITINEWWRTVRYTVSVIIEPFACLHHKHPQSLPATCHKYVLDF